MRPRGNRILRWTAEGLSDAIDGTNAFPGAMQSLADLVPSPTTKGQWVCRPAAVSLTTFAGFTAPAQVELVFVSGTRIYGLIASGRFAGKSEPFVYDTATNALVTVSGVNSGNVPTTAPTTGDWMPPTAARIGSRILFTHTGFSGSNYVGWLDMTSFSDATHTGTTTLGSTTISALSGNTLLAGWRPGMTISGTNIPAGATIVSVASNGLSCVISAAATASGTAIALTVSGGTLAAPLWGAGNINGNPLTAVPVAVAEYNGSAHFAVGNAIPFSDAGDPLQATNATQVITFQNGLPVTAFGGIGLLTQLGGVVQSLLAFQGAAQIQQITGSFAANTLAPAPLNVATGTLAPRSVVSTPRGILFAAPDGMRLVDLTGNISPVIGMQGKGIALPFLSALTPSRMAAAYSKGVYRISLVNGALTSQPTQEFWLHADLGLWSGPHSFQAAAIAALPGSETFVLAASGINAQLWQSDPVPSSTSTYTENGSALSFIWETALLPDTGAATENQIVESAIGLAALSTDIMTLLGINESGAVLDQINLMGAGSAGTLWNQFLWNQAQWSAGPGNYFVQYAVPWTKPLVFKQMRFRLTGKSSPTIVIGNLVAPYRQLGYLLQGAAYAS